MSARDSGAGQPGDVPAGGESFASEHRSLIPDPRTGRPAPMDWLEYSDAALSEWYALLSSDPEEAEVQAFLELHPSMVPGGSGDIGPGGHHGSEMSAVFAQPRLGGAGPDFEPDFMWVTRSSGLVTPILVEIEKPSKRWFQANGRPTAAFRDAHDQLNDWRSWFMNDENSALFRRTYLFNDSYADRPLEPQFVLIYGRKHEFELGGGHRDPDALRHKRDSQRGSGEAFMTFDSIRPRFDHRNSLTARMTAKGPRVHAFSPVFGTGTHTGADALRLGDPSAALERSVMMTAARKAYLAERWAHWRRVQLELNDRPPGAFVTRQMGVE